MSEKVRKTKIQRNDEEYFYLVRNGIIYRIPRGGKAEKVIDTGVEEDQRFIYYLDADGDLSRSPRAGGSVTEAQRSGISCKPFPGFSGDRLLSGIKFFHHRLGVIELYESERLNPDLAFDIWCAARAKVGPDLTAVLCGSRLTEERAALIRQLQEEELQEIHNLQIAELQLRWEKRIEEDLGRRWMKKQRRKLDKLVGDPPAYLGEGRSVLEEDLPFSCLVLLGCETWQIPVVWVFGGWNEVPEPREIAAVFRDWKEKYRAELFYVGSSFLEVHVPQPCPDVDMAKKLAWQQFLFSPDIVTQGTETVVALAQWLRLLTKWHFWWD